MKLTVTFNLILEIIKYLLMGYVFFGVKIRRKWATGGSVIVYAVLIGTGIWQTSDLAAASDNMQAIVVITIWIVSELPIKNRIIHVVRTYLIAVTVDSAIGMLLDILEVYTFSVKVPPEINWIINNTISISILLGFYGVKKKRLLENSRGFQMLTKVAIYICIAIMAIALPTTIVGLSYLGGKINDSALNRKLQILTVILLFSMLALAIFIIYVNDMNKKMKKYLEMEKTLKDTQKNYYEAMLAKEEDTRRFRHDVLNHLITLEELAKKGQMESIVGYIEEVQGHIVRIQKKCYSVGNTIIDAFLNYYVQMLEDNVEVKVIGCLTQEVSISDADLSTVFSNLIKNSIEELKKPSKGNNCIVEGIFKICAGEAWEDSGDFRIKDMWVKKNKSCYETEVL